MFGVAQYSRRVLSTLRTASQSKKKKRNTNKPAILDNQAPNTPPLQRGSTDLAPDTTLHNPPQSRAPHHTRTLRHITLLFQLHKAWLNRLFLESQAYAAQREEYDNATRPVQQRWGAHWALHRQWRSGAWQRPSRCRHGRCGRMNPAPPHSPCGGACFRGCCQARLDTWPAPVILGQGCRVTAVQSLQPDHTGVQSP